MRNHQSTTRCGVVRLGMESKQGSLASNSSSSTQKSSDDKSRTDITLNQGNDQDMERQLPHSLKPGIVKNANARLANPYLPNFGFR
jgi:hypothetical protein